MSDENKEILTPDPDYMKELRRRYVAQKRLENIPVQEIHEGLEDAGIWNPTNGKPYSLQTIYNDINHLDKELQNESLRDTSIHRARQLNEIREVKRRAFAMDNTAKGSKLILDAITLEAKLLGTFAPTKIDIRMLTVLVEKLEQKGIDPSSFIETTIKHIDSA